MSQQTAPAMAVVDDLAELSALVKRRRNLHVRWSPGPDKEGSPCTDPESGLPLPGVPARPLTAPDWWTRPVEDWLARQLRCLAQHRDGDRDARAWVLTGVDVGIGAEGEPLLGHVRPVAWVDDVVLDQAEHRYREHFSAAAADPG